jgi:hypothetical protein
VYSQPLEAAVSDGVDQADARDFVTSAIRAGLAGWQGVDAETFDGAPPVGVNGMIDGARKITKALGAGSRTTKPIVGRAPGWVDVLAGSGEAGQAGEAHGPRVAAAVARTRPASGSEPT